MKGTVMEFQSLTPMLSTTDIRQTVTFYTTMLGFQCEAMSEEWGWASVKRDQVAIMFALPNAHKSFDKPTLTGSLYIRVDDVDALWEQLKDKVEIGYPVESFDYGMREFGVYDNNGYMLQFGQELAQSEANQSEEQ